MSPFIVITKRPTDRGFSLSEEPVHEVSRRAVATLEEATAAAERAVRNCRDAAGTREAWDSAYASLSAAANLAEAGGTVGPLLDGTLIEVKSETWVQVAYWGGLRDRVLASSRQLGDPVDKVLKPFPSHSEILAAFNAQEAGTQ